MPLAYGLYQRKLPLSVPLSNEAPLRGHTMVHSGCSFGLCRMPWRDLLVRLRTDGMSSAYHRDEEQAKDQRSVEHVVSGLLRL